MPTDAMGNELHVCSLRRAGDLVPCTAIFIILCMVVAAIRRWMNPRDVDDVMRMSDPYIASNLIFFGSSGCRSKMRLSDNGFLYVQNVSVSTGAG